MSEKEGFSERLRSRRAELGLTQRDLSKKSNVAVPQISRYELGQSTPRADIAAKLAIALNVEIEWLLFGQKEFDLESPTLSTKKNTNLSSIETFEKFQPEINALLKTLKEQEEYYSILSEKVSNPFSKFEIQHTSMMLRHATSLALQSSEILKRLHTLITETHRSIKEHEKKYLQMQKLGKLDEYYEEQRNFNAYVVNYIVPKEIALALLNISTEEEANTAVDEFCEWFRQMKFPSVFSEEEANAQVSNALSHLLLTANLTNASVYARKALSELKKNFPNYSDKDEISFKKIA